MIISKTPLRMSFAGGGTDFKEYYKNATGSVISTTINKYVYVAVNKTFDDSIRVIYWKREEVKNVDDLEHNIVREALKWVGIYSGIEVFYTCDFSVGSAGIGLGSSSALAVGILNALYAFMGKDVSAEQLAKEACHIEIDVLSHPIGKQDQYAAAYGGFNHIQFFKNEDVSIEPIGTNELKEKLSKNLLLFYTGIPRISSDILLQQQNDIHKNKHYLNQLTQFVVEMKNALKNEDIYNFGEFLHEGWEIKKNLAQGITNEKIDCYYNQARRSGAFGGKILGAGGGGFLLLFCEERNRKRVQKELVELKEFNFEFENRGSKIIFYD